MCDPSGARKLLQEIGCVERFVERRPPRVDGSVLLLSFQLSLVVGVLLVVGISCKLSLFWATNISTNWTRLYTSRYRSSQMKALDARLGGGSPPKET